ncbi:MAG: M20 family metallopeptidase, partial [Anaerolineae bacterium]
MTKDLRTYLDARTQEMVAELRRLVELESPTQDKAAVDALGTAIATRAQALGATVTLHEQARRGNHVLARWNAAAPGKQILILCHMDTVWPLGTLAERPVRVEEGRFYGPGSYDMKAGIVVTLAALGALQALNLHPPRPITALFTSDEEVGSQTSRALIEDQARRSALVLVLEPCLRDGSLKTSRKGTGGFVVTARGVAAHAGGSHDEGVNAIEELAHQIIEIQGMTDYARGTTVNVGRVEGGLRTNVVPDQAQAWIDLRVATPQEGQRMLEKLFSLTPKLPGASVHVRGKLSRPPMPRDELMAQTFARAASIAAEIGLTLTEKGTGGASDGNLCAALGVPTLDGLGPVGAGAHALHEHVVVRD